MTREEKVKLFRDAANKKNYDGAPGEVKMIIGLIKEELAEFDEAVWKWELVTNEETRADLCKEWADLQYVVSQAALYFDIPADPAFNRVQESNMTKVVNGKCIFREDGKILKPDTYRAPDMRGL